MMGPGFAPRLPVWVSLALLILFVGGVLVVLLRHALGRRQRNAALRQLARRLGLTYTASLSADPTQSYGDEQYCSAADEDLMRQLGGPLNALAGTDRSARNLMHGWHDGAQWLVFDHWSAVECETGLEMVGATVVMLQQPRLSAAPLLVGPHLVLEYRDRRSSVPLTPIITGDAHFDAHFVACVSEPLPQWEPLGPEARRVLLEWLDGPLGQRWYVAVADTGVILWYDGLASPAQIAWAMDAVRRWQELVD